MPSENLLRLETSPYLLQHADNPVHWTGWNAAALEEARARKLPILLSIGYAACHWCHVMAHESFEDEEVAAVMNAHFVCVKVDREERPDIDDIYMTALSMMGEQGGWPLTMFLDPSGRPFWGGTYFPKTPAYGRPGFIQILNQISDAYQKGDPQIETNMRAIKDGLTAQATRDAAGDYPADLPGRALRSISAHIDETHGGMGGAPQFPQPVLYRFLLDQAQIEKDATATSRVLHTLTQICQGGIYDHLAGGFSRYTVDAAWLIPHFEKMLYDNGLLLGWLAQAWRITKNPLYARRTEETVAWLARDMLLDRGYFAASLDADSEGEEGKYYVWSWDELGQILGDHREAFAAAYGCSAAGNFEGNNIPNRLGQDETDSDTLKQWRAQLLAMRAKRPAPGQDDKVLADWNGLIIAGLTEAATVLDRPDWLALAEKAFAAIIADLSEGNGLVHSARGDSRMSLGLGEDLVLMSDAALHLYSATGRTSYLTQAQAWMDQLEMAHACRGGYSSAAASQNDILVHNRPVFDNAVPSLNGSALLVLAKLAHFTGERSIYDRAARLRQNFSGLLPRSYIQMPRFLSAARLLDQAITAVIMTDDVTNADYRALYRELAEASGPDLLIVTHHDDASPLPTLHPAYGKKRVDDKPTVYLCPTGSCLPPLTTIQALKEQLSRLNLSSS